MSVVVNISRRDLENLDDCDDAIFALSQRAEHIQLTFVNDELAWVREKLTADKTGWADDVAVTERAHQQDTILELNHSRGLARKSDEEKEQMAEVGLNERIGAQLLTALKTGLTHGELFNRVKATVVEFNDSVRNLALAGLVIVNRPDNKQPKVRLTAPGITWAEANKSKKGAAPA